MGRYHRLRVVHGARRLTCAIYRDTARFPATERYGLTSQMRRAPVSSGANVAEGCGRNNDQEFARFIAIAMGTAAELGYLSRVAGDLGFLTQERFEALGRAADELRRMLFIL